MTSSRAPALGSQSGAGEANVMAIDHDHDHEEVQVNRRHILCGGGAAVVGAMITSLLGGTKPVRAASISGAVPEVDELAVRVVTDSYQFAVAPSRKADGVDIQHFGWGIGGDKPPGKTLISEFGLSIRGSTSITSYRCTARANRSTRWPKQRCPRNCCAP